MVFKKWFGKKADEAEAPREGEGRRRFSFLRKGLEKTRSGLMGLLSVRRKIDDELILELEARMYEADFGPETVEALIDGEQGIRAAWKQKLVEDSENVVPFLKGSLKQGLARRPNALCRAESGPTIVLIAGVNGSGKTTSIAKLANRLHDDGDRIIVAAADTWRAAAVEQLGIWCERAGIEMVRGKEKADPGSVAYQGAERAVESGADFLIVDTAGRLHTHRNLMRELTKVRDVIARKVPGAPHEILLVLDATNGQNAINQVDQFHQALGVTGIFLAKLDGTAKGGFVITIHNRLDIPVKFVGIGEGIEDIEPFDPDAFVDALFE